MNRAKEIFELLNLGPEELVARSDGRLVILDTLDDLHQHFARSIADEIKKNNESQKPSVFIMPYGPVPQYPIFVQIINQERISLKDCTFFFMDENADKNGVEVAESHPESFRAGVKKLFSAIEESLAMPEDQVIFPSSENVHQLQQMIAERGGIQLCYGGIGIHGHVAFNEPEPGVRYTDPRLVYLNDFTITINAIRSGVGGDLDNFPNKALTLGMKQILGAEKIRLYCRNDIAGIDWANTVLRLAVLGKAGDDYPVTYLREHDDWMVITDRNTAAKPDHILEPFGS